MLKKLRRQRDPASDPGSIPPSPHVTARATGHWVRDAGILAPLVIGELVEDVDKRWRYIRIASVATALLSEALWTSRINRERQEREADRQRCESPQLPR